MQYLKLAVALIAAVAAGAPGAQEVKRTPLPPDHPVIGTWKFVVPDTQCTEIYDVRADGTSRVTSAEQVIETEFTISPGLNAQGFYKWVDRITHDNGKPDCMGTTGEVGRVVTNYVRIHRTGTKFIVCRKEDLDTCFGPFVLQPKL
jgi:hypothetical protein